MHNKLVYILNQYSDDESSHYHHIINLIDEIAKKGVDVAVIIEKCSAKPIFESKNVTLYSQRHYSSLTRIIELFFLIRLLFKNGYKTVFVRISVIAAVIVILHRKVYGGRVYFWQSGTTHQHDKKAPWNLRKIKWLLYSRIPFLFTVKHVDYFVTGPESMARYYSDVVGVAEKKLVVLYNDINLMRFMQPSSPTYKKDIRESLSLPINRNVLLFVHRLSPVKKTLFYLPYVIEEFFRRCDLSSDFVFVIVGDGDDKPALASEIRRQGLSNQVILIGRIPNKNIQQYYLAADIFFQPTYEEGFPRVMIEAMASGLPIVSTDAGGIPDLIGPCQARYIVSRDDRDAFVDKLIELVTTPGKWPELRKENLELVKRYSTEAVADMYIEKLFCS